MDKVKELISKAEKLAKEALWDDNAIKLNFQIIKLDKKNAGAYCRLGCCFEEKGDLAQAKKAFKNALIINNKSQGYRNALDRVEAKIKEISDKECIGEIKKYDEAFQIGMNAKNNGDINFAILALKKAIELKPTAYALTALAAAYRAEGLLDQAEVLYRNVLKIDDNAVVRTGLAAVLKDKRSFKEVEKLIEETLKVDNNDIFALRTAGSVYSKMRKKDKASECFNKSFEIETEKYINGLQ